tara:strand:- start:4477 stop:5166 length:690 start_codon:yes stop_codon:yes gene_type:complete
MVHADSHAFSLTLTNACTGGERREYVDTIGTTWVKGEKDEEFFLVLKNTDLCDTLCKILVDNVDIGYLYEMPQHGLSAPLGILKSGQSWSDSNLTSHAFKFVEKKRAPLAPGDEDQDGRLPSSGSVIVYWYKCKWDYDSVKSETRTTSSWSGAASASSSMHKKEQSQLCSEEGSIASTLTVDLKGPTARCGELLATTTVQYTSDFGLAVRGLLSSEETGMTVKRQKIVV